MKIIYIENVRIPSERAHAYQIVQQCSWMGRMGHDVTLVNPDRAGGKDVFSYFNIPDRPFTHVVLPTTDWLDRVPWWLKPFAYVWQRRTFIKSLRAWAKKQPSAVWYTRDPALADAIMIDRRDNVFLELHNAPHTNMRRWELIRGAIAGFIVITRGLHDLLVKLEIPEERIHIAPDGYDPKEFEHLQDRGMARKELGIPLDSFVVFYGGSFYSWKGLDPIVESWSETDPRAHLVLIGGPDPDTKRLEKLVPSEAKERVHILPRRPRAELVSIYSVADIGLISSSLESNHSALYTSPLKLFEYLAAGLPVLASDVPTSREVLDESVAKFFLPTKEDFHRALREIMQDSTWMRSAAEEAPEFVKRYTWQERVSGIVDWIRGRLR